MHRWFVVLAFVLAFGFAAPVAAGEGCKYSDKAAVQAKVSAPEKAGSSRVEAEKARKTCEEGVACEAEHAGDQQLAARDKADD